jgi:hypothetical protein
MSRFKDFGSGKTDLSKYEPLSFKLYDEEFNCVPAVQGKFLIDLVASAESDDSSSSLKIITSFFENVLTDESNVRFESLISDKEKIVTVESLSEIVSWLMSEYTNRPNQLPEDSSPGQ